MSCIMRVAVILPVIITVILTSTNADDLCKYCPQEKCSDRALLIWLLRMSLLPLAVPFFFFPFSSSYSSGFIMPSYMDDSTRGFGLTDGGYYFAISDKMDLKLRGDIFTKGSWALNAETNYNVRYKFSGLFQASYQVTKTGDKGLDDYAVAKDFKVVWSHRQDPKASPNRHSRPV